MKKKSIITIFILFFTVAPLVAEHLNSPSWGYAIDLPESFVLTNKNENNRYLFQHSIQPVDFQIALYSKEEFKTIKETSEHIISRLKMQHKDIKFLWRNKQAFLSMVTFHYNPGKNYKPKNLSGWLLTLELPNEKGWLGLLSYTDSEKAKEYEPLMISTLDTVYTDTMSYITPGPVTTALYPKTKSIETSYSFNNKTMVFKYNESDAQANQSVIDREFRLLTIYLNHDTVFEAWKRFYRTIFRDAWERITPFSFAIQTAYRDFLTNNGFAVKKVSEEILKFIQSFKYIRDREGSDFINLPQAFLKKQGDCDARSLLMVLLLKQMNIDAILLISPDKQHSILGIDCQDYDEDSKLFEHNSKKYLLAETTSHDPLGKTDKNLMTKSNWFAVNFYITEY